MNILIIGTTDNFGGASRVGWDLGSEMKKKGHVVKFMVGRKATNFSNVIQLKKCSIFETIRKSTGKDVGLFIKQLRDYFLSNDIQFGADEEIINHRWYKETDIVHFHNLHGNYFKLETIKRICKEKKVVWTLHDMWSFTGHCAHSFDCNNFQTGCGSCPYLKTYFPYFWDNTSNILRKKSEIYKNSNFTVVSPSKWLISKLNASILKNHKKELIYNGIDTNLFKKYDKIRSRKDLKLPLNKKIILTVAQGGNKNLFKGGQYLNNFTEQLDGKQNLMVTIGGTKENKENSISLGYISDQKQLAKYYSAADVFLFPSLAENCPLVVLESMSRGLPVVAFNVGGVPEIVKHKLNGYISKYKDGTDLLEGVNYILNLDPETYSSMSESCIKRVEKEFSLKKMIDSYTKIYSK